LTARPRRGILPAARGDDIGKRQEIGGRVVIEAGDSMYTLELEQSIDAGAQTAYEALTEPA